MLNCITWRRIESYRGSDNPEALHNRFRGSFISVDRRVSKMAIQLFKPACRRHESLSCELHDISFSVILYRATFQAALNCSERKNRFLRTGYKGDGNHPVPAVGYRSTRWPRSLETMWVSRICETHMLRTAWNCSERKLTMRSTLRFLGLLIDSIP